MQMTLSWGDRATGSEVALSTAGELDAQLDRLDKEAAAAGRPVMVDLTPQNGGPYLTLGLGAEQSAVGWTDPSGHTDNLMSRGAREAEVPATAFSYANQESEIPATAMVEKSAAWEAARHFFETGERPENIEWDAV